MSPHSTPPSSEVSPVLREFAGKSGVMPVSRPTEEDPNRKGYISYVLVPAGMDVVFMEEPLNKPKGFLAKLPFGMLWKQR